MPRSESPAIPKLRLHKASGNAAVMLNGRYLYLGRFGTPEAQERYDRLVGEWLAKCRRTDGTEPAQLVAAKAVAVQQRAGVEIADLAAGRTVNEIIAAYWDFAVTFYRRDGEPTEQLNHVRRALRPLRKMYGSLPATEFSPLKLKALREVFVRGDVEYDERCTRSPQAQSRTHINANVQRIKRVFKFAVEHEMVPGHVYHALQAVSGLRKGRSDAREGRVVKPVPLEYVEAILVIETAADGTADKYSDGKPRTRYVTPEVAAMVRLQMLTGMRSGEVCQMRTCDVDTSGDLWAYRPQHHKTEHLDVTREIWLGPRAQALLSPWLRMNVTESLFSPLRARQRAWADARAARTSSVQPSQADRAQRGPGRQREWRDVYSVDVYRRAISQALRQLNAERRAAGRPEVAHWHPHRLRHSHATEVRRRFGLELARAALGHKDIRATQVYAEADIGRAREVAMSIG
jgi:integrase